MSGPSFDKQTPYCSTPIRVSSTGIEPKGTHLTMTLPGHCCKISMGTSLRGSLPRPTFQRHPQDPLLLMTVIALPMTSIEVLANVEQIGFFHVSFSIAVPCRTPHSFALLLFPNRCGPFFWPIIFFAEKPRISPLDAASPLFAKRFLPPNPNLSSFFCRLFGGPRPRSPRLDPCLADRSALSALLASSRATSKRSSSLGAPTSVFFRSGHR